MLAQDPLLVSSGEIFSQGLYAVYTFQCLRMCVHTAHLVKYDAVYAVVNEELCTYGVSVYFHSVVNLFTYIFKTKALKMKHEEKLM